MILPDDIIINIFSYLLWEDVKKFKNIDSLLLFHICLQNPQTNDPYSILQNIYYDNCYHCYNSLEFSYVIKLCDSCKFFLDDKKVYPNYCYDCLPLKKKRNFETQICNVCNNTCFCLGIEPYS